MKMMITGGRGMLGRTLQREFAEMDLVVSDREECDITNPVAVDRFIGSAKPDVLIHCAAMTAVDECESHINEAYKVNAAGSANVASACRRHGTRLIAISTDYVFDGSLYRPYTEYDATAPRTVYGKSKCAGEEAVRCLCPNHLIARVSWLYGSGGPSFPHSMMRIADGSRPVVKVVSDQVGNPTSTAAAAQMIRRFIPVPSLCGTFHVTCEGEASWYDFAEELFRLTGTEQKIEKCSTEEFPRPAPRPHNSRLDKMNLRLYGFPHMPQWKEALADFVKEEGWLKTEHNS